MYGSQKQISWAKLRVGLVTTAGLAVLFLVILFAGSIRRIFTPQAQVYAEFSDVRGLRPGAPVWFAGVQIGSVRSIRFEGGEQITATLDIDRSAMSYLKKDTTATILTMGLLGDKYVEVEPGSRQAAELEPGDMISGSVPVEITEELKRFVATVEKGKGSLGRLLKDDTLYRSLTVSVNDIKAFAKMLKTSEGTLIKTIRDPALYNRFLKATESIDSFAARLASSKGTVNRLVEDASLYENMNGAAERLNTILKKVERGEGAMGSLITSKELTDEMRSAVKEFHDLVKDIKEHPKKYFSISVF